MRCICAILTLSLGCASCQKGMTNMEVAAGIHTISTIRAVRRVPGVRVRREVRRGVHPTCAGHGGCVHAAGDRRRINPRGARHRWRICPVGVRGALHLGTIGTGNGWQRRGSKTPPPLPTHGKQYFFNKTWGGPDKPTHL